MILTRAILIMFQYPMMATTQMENTTLIKLENKRIVDSAIEVIQGTMTIHLLEVNYARNHQIKVFQCLRMKIWIITRLFKGKTVETIQVSKDYLMEV